MFWSGVPLGGHLTSFCYAPPDTGESDLIPVAVERLLSIEGADEIRIDVTFLRGKAPLSGELSAKLTERLQQICHDLSVSAFRRATSPERGGLGTAHSNGFPYEGKLSPQATDEVGQFRHCVELLNCLGSAYRALFCRR